MPKTETLDECVDRVLSFDEIAEVAIYLYADVARAKKAQEALCKARNKCQWSHREIRGGPCDVLEALVGWDGLYNDRVRGIVDEFGFPRFVDRWGALCWTDINGDHCGDQSGFYPFWDSEAALRKRLEEGKTPRE